MVDIERQELLLGIGGRFGDAIIQTAKLYPHVVGQFFTTYRNRKQDPMKWESWDEVGLEKALLSALTSLSPSPNLLMLRKAEFDIIDKSDVTEMQVAFVRMAVYAGEIMYRVEHRAEIKAVTLANALAESLAKYSRNALVDGYS